MLLGRSTGGIGTHVAQLSADLRDRGVQVIVVTDPLTAASFDLAPVRLCWPGSAGRARAAGDLGRLRALVATADIVHAHGHRGALLATLATLGSPRRAGRPKLVVSLHNTVLAAGPQSWLKKLAQRWVAARADLVTGASMDLVREAQAFGAARTELAEVPSPRVPALLAQPRPGAGDRARIRTRLLSTLALQGVDLAAPLVVTICRIAPQKNLPVLVAAASRLPLGCTWVVLGEGDPQLLAALRAQVRALGAPVHFVGARSEVDSWLRGAEVFVLASQWEARALVVQEAMAAGTPVVATDVGGLHDLLAGTGLLVPAGDPVAIADATGRVLADPRLREELAAHGREVAAVLPDGRDTASRWSSWYAQTLLMT
jgi:glycosyltransferase involved in cell wall biosynthesis